MAYPSARRIRPWLCALIAAAVVVGLALTSAFTWVAYRATPEIIEEIRFSQTAPVPPLPPAEPVAAAAQAALNEAGGARWTGETRFGERVVNSDKGAISFDGDVCSSEARLNSIGKDGREGHSSLFVVDGHRAATLVPDAETTITEDEFSVEWSAGEWEGTFPVETAHTPAMLSALYPISACTLITDVSRSVIKFREQPDVVHLPPAGEGVTRHVGAIAPELLLEVSTHFVYRLAEESLGHAPSNRTMYVAQPSVGAFAQKVQTVTLDVDSSGAPVALWVVLGNPGTTTPMIVSMHFSDLGPQQISFPEGVVPPPLMEE